MKKLLVLMFACVLIISFSTFAIAARIVYSLEATSIVSILNDAVYQNVQVNISFEADTEDSYWKPEGSGFGLVEGWFLEDVQSTISIEGIASDIEIFNTIDLLLRPEYGQFFAATRAPGDTTYFSVTDVALEGGTLSENYIINPDPDHLSFNGVISTEVGDMFVVNVGDSNSHFTAHIVPIPSTILLLGVGVMSLAGLGRRLKRLK